MLYWYQNTAFVKDEVPEDRRMPRTRRGIERVQTGVRIEKRILKILKAIAARHEIPLGDLLEGIVLHSFEGKCPFDTDSLAFIDTMRTAYGLDLSASDSHRLFEKPNAPSQSE